MKIKIKLLLLLFCISGPLILSFGHGDTLDSKLFYTNKYAANVFLDLTEAQRWDYTLGAIFDIFFLISYSGLGFYLLKKLYAKSSLKFVSIVAGCFDFIETMTSILILSSVMAVPFYLPYATLLKWVFVVLAVLLILSQVGLKFLKRK